MWQWLTNADQRHSRIAALYFCCATLFRASFASWTMMNLLLVVVPRYGAYGMISTGICMLLTNLIYWALLPCEPLTAHIDGSILAFNLGWNYWLVLLSGRYFVLFFTYSSKEKDSRIIPVTGIGCLFVGAVITAIDMIFPHQFSTILEVDYDTPYDRHVIIEESFDTRNIRRRLPKIEDSFGDRIIR